MDFEIPEPCSEDWGRMSPEQRGRRCAKCRTTVHDLSPYSPEEAEELLTAGECVRAQVLPDGRVATRPSRVGRVLLAAVAAPALLALAGCLQGKPSTATDTEAASADSGASPGAPASGTSSAEPR